MSNLTISGCNTSRIMLNVTETDTTSYVNACLRFKHYMPVENCTRLIEDYVFPQFSEWIIISIYCVIFFLGLIGNGLVCFVVLRVAHMRSVVNIFILNLAVADFMVLLICLPPSVLADTTESWYLGDAMCKVVPFLQTVSVAVSVLTLSGISVERYFAICHPLNKRLNTRKLSVFIAIIWIAAALMALPELLYQKLHNSYPDHVTPYLKYCRLTMTDKDKKYYQLFLMVILYDLPMCLMFFAYTTISVRLWKDTFSGPKEDVRTQSGRIRHCPKSRPENQVYTRRKAAKMLMTIVILFAICYLPVHILNILMYNGSLNDWDGVAIVTYALVSRGLCYFNSAMNPVIYNFMSAKFRQEFKAALSTCRCGRKHQGKAHMTYNFRSNRSVVTRTGRYTMNTLSTRPNCTGRSASPCCRSVSPSGRSVSPCGRSVSPCRRSVSPACRRTSLL